MNALTSRRLAVLAALTTVYLIGSRFGPSLAFAGPGMLGVWPRTGLALSLMLVAGRTAWPAILAGSFLVNITSAGLPLAIAVALADTVEGLVGVWLLQRVTGGRTLFRKAGSVFAFACIVVPVAAATGAVIGGAALALGGPAPLPEIVARSLQWWLGDSAGATIITPLAALVRSEPRPSWDARTRVEALLLLGALVLTGLVVFRGLVPVITAGAPIEFLVLPVLFWAALRFGQREAVTACAIISAFALWGTMEGLGPFGRLASGGSFGLLGAFVAVITVAMLAASTEVARRRASDDELTRLNADLERRVALRTEELHRTHARLADAQRVAHIGSWEWAVDTNTLWWSAELYRIYGIDSAVFPASYEGFLSLVHPEDRAAVDGVVRRALDAGGGPFEVEHRIVRPTGEVRTLHGRGRVVVDAAGRAIQMLGTGQDITERRRADEERAQLAQEQALRREAEEANKAKDQFLTVLSHELRTPANAVMGWAQLLEHAALDERGRRKALDAIRRNALIQTELVSDILDAARIRTGTMHVDRQRMDLSPSVESAVESVRPAALAKGIHFTTELEPAMIVGDPQRIGQVVRNLLSNAVKFSSIGGRVGLRTTCTDGGVTIVVEDDGPGISPDFLPHLFEQFRQADPSATREHQGLGLGLAIVRQIVELHGGTVDASHGAGGRGAVFTVRLPLDPADPASGEAGAGVA